MHNQEPEPQAQQQDKAGKWMLTFAWLAALLLLTLWFDDLLMDRINPNSDPISMSSSSGIEVNLKRNVMGHYVTTGTINGQKVIFLLDTGATDVSIPAHMADKLGLVPGRRSRSMTANGTVTVYDTHIDEVGIGDILLRDIEGNLNPGMNGNEILLGMSALKQLEFTQKNGWLLLRDTNPY